MAIRFPYEVLEGADRESFPRRRRRRWWWAAAAVAAGAFIIIAAVWR